MAHIVCTPSYSVYSGVVEGIKLWRGGSPLARPFPRALRMVSLLLRASSRSVALACARLNLSCCILWISVILRLTNGLGLPVSIMPEDGATVTPSGGVG